MADLQVYRKQTQTVLILSLLLGVTLISCSFLFGENSVIRELVKELGIVLVSVFGVSILYEIFVAEKHFLKFNEALGTLIERGETNAAVCARLGILQIFPTRTEYLKRYEFERLCRDMTSESRLRVVGTTLFAIMRQQDSLLSALEKGALIELAALDPDSPNEIFEQLKHTVRKDELRASLERFNELCTTAASSKVSGTLELRFHKIALFDNLAEFQTPSDQFSIWEVSFAAGEGNKRDFLLDPDKPFAKDLHRRYDRVWQSGITAFRYSAGALIESSRSGVLG